MIGIDKLNWSLSKPLTDFSR